MMEAESTSEMSVNFYKTTLRYNPEDSENLKSFLPETCLNSSAVFVYPSVHMRVSCVSCALGAVCVPDDCAAEIRCLVRVCHKNLSKFGPN
jgi:hypothetical protein